MTNDQPAAGDEWWRRVPLYAVVVGAMAVSIGGQVATLEDRIGHGWAIVLSLTNDAGAIIALDAAFSRFADKAIRTWAWFAILLAGGTGAALNTWHTIHGDNEAALKDLPTIYGWLIGIEPILLVLILTHLVGLLTAARRGSRASTASASDRTVADAVADHQRATASATASTTSATTSRNRQRPPAPTTSDRQPTASGTASRPPAAPAGDRQTPLVMTASGDASGALVITGASISSPSGSAQGRSGKPASRQPAGSPSKGTRPTARQDWMTDLLVHQVARKLAAAAAAGDTYGRPQLMAEHTLTDYRARALLAYIAERDLAREAAS